MLLALSREVCGLLDSVLQCCEVFFLFKGKKKLFSSEFQHHSEMQSLLPGPCLLYLLT